MPGEVEGYVKKNNKIKRERLRNVLRKDPYCETKILSSRFGFCGNIIQDERKEILKELGLKPLNSTYVTVQEARKKAPVQSFQWYPRLRKKKNGKKKNKV
jgi:hypothetical protein